VPNPILHFLGLVASMGPDFRVLPEQVIGGHTISGFTSAGEGGIQLLLYSHDGLDTEARSRAEFDVTVKFTDLKLTNVAAHESRFDKDHNSYFRLGRALREQADGASSAQDSKIAAAIGTALQDLHGDRMEMRLAALDKIASLGPQAASAASAIFSLLEHADDASFREKAEATLKRITAARAYPVAEVRKIEDASRLRHTASHEYRVAADGSLSITVRVSGNGANFVHIVP
jgi:hypothetical protein